MDNEHAAEQTSDFGRVTSGKKRAVGCGFYAIGAILLLLVAVLPRVFAAVDNFGTDQEEVGLAEEFEDEEAEFADDFVEEEGPGFDDESVDQEFAFADEPDWERNPWAYDDAPIDFADMPTPTFQARLADLGGDRIREIEFFLQEGDSAISFGILNPEPIRIDGQGIAVRTDDFAQILRASRSFETSRPVDCIDGNCRLFMWLTMGPTFLDNHPDAELLIWAGEGAAVTIEPMPIGNIRAETFR